ncbi:hypothetical protein [Helicobacter sp. L8]|uniref:hypothetical protein n=1 Tax=Helicobacter sp. L8 TaxID=2316078 RepID=UPI0013CDF8B7|nr:hypothetical protein [Helicobacter sp. L8]
MQNRFKHIARVFHIGILACLCAGCGYKAAPFYKAKPSPYPKAQMPNSNHMIQENTP